MATNSANVDVAITGEVSLAPDGTAIPTDATTAIDVAFVGLGYLDDSGIRENINESWSTITAYQNGDEVRRVRTSHSVEYSFTLLETNADTLAAYYGDHTAGTVKMRGDVGTRGPWVAEALDGDKIVRIVIPDGEVVSRGEVSYVNGEAIKYPITVACYPGTSGDKAIKYYDDVA